MALQKQNVPISFNQGLDTKTDPYQLPLGKFAVLENSVFQKDKLLQKRNGYPQLTSLPDTTYSFITTFNNNLTAIGTSFAAYSQGSETWVNKGRIEPLQLSTIPLIRSNTSHTQADSAVSSNGLVCVVYTDNVPVAGVNTLVYKYAIADSITGQNVVTPTVITSSGGVITYAPKVFLLRNYFIIVFDSVISATNHLQYIAVSTVSLLSTVATDISTSYAPASTGSFDGIVANDNLYLAWNGSDGGGAIRATFIDQTLVQHNTVTFAGRVATHMSVTADTIGSTPIVYATFYDSGAATLYSLAVNQQLNTVLAPTVLTTSGTVLNVATTAQSGVLTYLLEIGNNYSYDAAIPTHLINKNTMTQAGVVGTIATLKRSVGLASKPMIVGTNTYFLAVYYSLYQPTYFLLDILGKVVAKLAYQNAGGYSITGLPSISIDGDTIQFPYLFKDLIAPGNKFQGAASSTGVYSQTGINMATITFGTDNLNFAEIGNNLNLSGGFLWAYDGYIPVEQNFFLYPDNVELVVTSSGGSMIVQDYFYQALYEWTDQQGNIFRSAPSIPVKAPSASFNSSNNKVVVNIPMLRLTYKLANPVKIVIFRWSTAQQTYYQVTSITLPTLNDVTLDSVAFTDTQADTSIIGNSIIYTNGGVVENTGGPATTTMTLFKSRLILLNAENQNLLSYSKQVIEGVPVELSDLFTIYVNPTISAQGSTGLGKCLAAMDDKCIIFKKNAIYYFTGTGPDNTGANNDFGEPTFVTSTVGCSNQVSIVFIPQGLMFQSDKGIWLLGRDLTTTFIGADVEDFTTDYTVKSAVNIPGTNQVRFTMSSGVTLVYDYYVGQWGSFSNVPAISSTIYQNLHTFINEFGQVYQESLATYLDGSRAVLMAFTTGWINLAGLQGFQRAYEFYIMGTYKSPHKLSVSIAYDYNSSPTQNEVISPNNYSGVYGSDLLYGGSGHYGGTSPLEQWRIFFQIQKCQAFQITVREVFDPTLGTVAGEGLSISGINITVGLKATRPKLRANQAVG